MINQTPGPPDPNSPFAAPLVWPPPPTNAPFPTAGTSPLAPLDHFQTQNVWLILLLTLITGGIYGVFLLRRLSVQTHALRPDLMPAGALRLANLVLGLTVLSTLVDLANLFSNAPGLDTVSNLLGRGVGLLILVLSFQVRNGFNGLIGAQKGDIYWFSGLFTWLLSVVYLQHHLNQNIGRRQAEARAGVAV